MTAREFEAALGTMTDEQRAQIDKFFGGDCTTTEMRVRWFLEHGKEVGRNFEARLAHILGLPTEEEKIAMRSGGTSITNYGNVGVLAGRDVTIDAEMMFAVLIEQVEAAPIPDEEKKGLRAKLKELASNPIIQTLGTTALTAWVKRQFGVPG